MVTAYHRYAHDEAGAFAAGERYRPTACPPPFLRTAGAGWNRIGEKAELRRLETSRRRKFVNLGPATADPTGCAGFPFCVGPPECAPTPNPRSKPLRAGSTGRVF